MERERLSGLSGAEALGLATMGRFVRTKPGTEFREGHEIAILHRRQTRMRRPRSSPMTSTSGFSAVALVSPRE